MISATVATTGVVVVTVVVGGIIVGYFTFKILELFLDWLDELSCSLYFDIAILVEINEQRRSLPKEGTPNTDDKLYDEKGVLKQERHYGEDGQAEYDIDYKHPDDGTHEFPHVHFWLDGSRSKWSIPLADWLFLNQKA